MKYYNIKFFVRGDSVVDDLIISKTIDCETLEDVIEFSYKEYKKALRYIYKKLEADVKCEPKPHNNFTVVLMGYDGKEDENLVLKAFFKKRMLEFKDMHPYWN